MSNFINFRICIFAIRECKASVERLMDYYEVNFTFNQINRNIKREDTSLRNRIQSILLDNAFIVERVLPRFPNYPLVPNERCGVWYCNPKHFKMTSYFKSTDGHMNQWDFSTRRLNLHLLTVLQENGGIIIVDSTRRGKLIPDSLSKTIPIWCAVLNSFMFPDKSEGLLFTPPNFVSRSEHDNIKGRIAILANRLKKLEILDSQELRIKFQEKILRPFWVYPGCDMLRASTDPFNGEIIEETWKSGSDESIIPIILCTASYRVQDGVEKKYGFTYVQGAADDHESWSCGLDPETLWGHWDYFHDINHDDKDLEDHVKYLLQFAKKKAEHEDNLADILEVDHITEELSLGKMRNHTAITPKIALEIVRNFSLVIILSKTVILSTRCDFIKIYNLQSGSKRSSKDLRALMIEIDHMISAQLCKCGTGKKPILVSCNSGADMSVGVILMVLCKYYSQNWVLGRPEPVTKFTIRRHLTHIINKIQSRNVNPSRATLNSINSFLMNPNLCTLY